jgi:hypothetical protein
MSALQVNSGTAKQKVRPKAINQSSVFEMLTLRLANFADGNEHQHSKDRKSYHHRATPSSAQRYRMAAAKAFALKRCPSVSKFEHC